jgi:hypothetical protein
MFEVRLLPLQDFFTNLHNKSFKKLSFDEKDTALFE